MLENSLLKLPSFQTAENLIKNLDNARLKFSCGNLIVLLYKERKHIHVMFSVLRMSL